MTGRNLKDLLKTHFESLVAAVSLPVRLEAVQQLTVETESEGSVRLQWRQVPGVRGYRVVWGPFTGQRSSLQPLRTMLALCYTNASVLLPSPEGRDVETVEMASDTTYHTLSNLQHDTEYIVTIIPLYNGNTEGPVATARFKIGLFLLLLSKSFLHIGIHHYYSSDTG